MENKFFKYSELKNHDGFSPADYRMFGRSVEHFRGNLA